MRQRPFSAEAKPTGGLRPARDRYNDESLIRPDRIRLSSGLTPSAKTWFPVEKFFGLFTDNDIRIPTR